MKKTDLISYRSIVELDDIQQVVSLQTQIWGPNLVTPLPQLVASIHHGGVIIGAFAEHQLVGFCYGFPGLKDRQHYLVSHMAAVSADYQNYGIGYELKMRQREWATAYGYQKMVWTTDPLEVRNGFFNMCKLGAYARTYICSYYGELQDNLNTGLPSDRLLMEWDLCSSRVEHAASGRMLDLEGQLHYETILETTEEANLPIRIGSDSNWQAEGYKVKAPANIQLIKATNSDAAKAWRFLLREVLSEAFNHGFMLSSVQKIADSSYHYYILEKKEGGIVES